MGKWRWEADRTAITRSLSMGCHPEGPRQAKGRGQQESHDSQQGQMQILYLRQTKPLHRTGWGLTGREQHSWKGPGEQRATEKSAPCRRSKEGEQCCGLC